MLISKAFHHGRWLPALALTIWLVFLGTALWQHIKVAETPPNYDPLSYAAKAKYFWEQVRAGNLRAAFTVEPSVRPVGTVLMSYPIGFDMDFRGYYFRSVFVPIVLLVVAAYVVGYQRDMSTGDLWRLMAIGMFLSTLPAFYHFEFGVLPSPVCWGLVDNFIAGTAACAMAAALRSLREDSRPWLAIASLLACLAFFVKPAGLAVMALISLCWLLGTGFRLQANRAARGFSRLDWKGIVLSTATMAGIFVGFFWLAIATGYFSRETVGFGRRALSVAREVLTIRLVDLPSMINMSFGIVQSLVVVLICILGAFYSLRARRDPALHVNPTVGVLFLSALLCVGAGVWLWLVAFGAGSQIRYFFPFGFMALTALVPVAQFVAEKLPRRGRAALGLIVLVLVANIAALLVYPEPSIGWQRRAGVNLLANGYKTETDQAKRLLAEVSARDGRAMLYVFPSSTGAQVIHNYVEYARLADLTSAVLGVHFPYDWSDGFGVRTSHLLDSHYVVFEPILDAAQRTVLLSLRQVIEFDQEEKVFRAWLTGASEQDGLRKVSETSVRILRVEDHARFEVSMDRLIQHREWRPFFVESRRPPWWRIVDFAEYTTTHRVSALGTRFADLFLLHGLELERKDSRLSVTIWWERLGKDPNIDWVFFIHEIDKDREIVADHAIPLGHLRPFRSDKPIRRDTGTILLAPGARVKGLAAGFFRPVTGPLVADRGDRDWNGRRILVSLPAQPRQPSGQ